MTKNEYLLQQYLDGKLTNVCLRMHRDKLLVTKKPVFQPGRPVTEKQAATRALFKEATVYAQKVSQDPAKRAAYEPWCKKHQTIRNVALADYMEGPVIHGWNLSGYHRRRGDRIYIEATDNVCLTRVMCRIRSALGFPLEEGFAVYRPDIEKWEYTQQRNHALVAGGLFLFKAWDLAGNTTIQRVRYSRGPG